MDFDSSSDGLIESTVEIKSIESAGKADVYDLYCSESDTWVTEGGIIQRGCGEQQLPPHTSCNLASIDLSRFLDITVEGGAVDWDKLQQTIEVAVKFLDGSIDNSFFPVPKVEEKTKMYRNIGLGVMGWADLLIMLGIPYDSSQAVELAREVMKFINTEAWKVSVNISETSERKNTTLTSIAPTGSISALTGCSSGIEPLFGVVFSHHSYSGTIQRVHWIFEKIAKERDFYSEELMREIAKNGTVQGSPKVPEDVQRLFRN